MRGPTPTLIRNIFIAVLLFVVAPCAWATGQAPDVIYINGEKWALLAKPLPKDLRARLDAFLPPHDSRAWNTANLDGYTCVWSIEGNRIYLKAVEVDMYDSQKKEEYTVTYTADSLKDVFKGYRCTRRGIEAKWIGRDYTLRAGKGKVIRYVHAGYNRIHETEMHFNVHKGKIADMQLRRYRFTTIYITREHNGRKYQSPAICLLQYRTLQKLIF